MLRTSLPSLKKNWSECSTFEILIQFVKKVKEKPLALILFGSWATNNYFPSSDIDVLVLYEKKKDLLAKGLELRRLDPSGAVEPFVYGKDQLKKMIADLNPFILNVLMDGIVLYESIDSNLKEIERTFSETLQKFSVVREHTCWKIRDLKRWSKERI